jgi:hypothetical protein
MEELLSRFDEVTAPQSWTHDQSARLMKQSSRPTKPSRELRLENSNGRRQSSWWRD